MGKNIVVPASRIFGWRKLFLSVLVAVLVTAILAFSPGQVTALAHVERTANTFAGCQIFPSNNIWNQDISALPVAANSANYMASIGLNNHLDGSFGSGQWAGSPLGFPYSVVPAGQPTVPVSFTYASESDPGPYPIPPNAPIEGGAQSSGDRHVIVLNSGTCKLYETYSSYPQPDGSWKAGSGAIWDLNSNALRPQGWTSADAAGLPMFAGFARYDEIVAGVITHALRFTVNQTQQAYIWPARHYASSNTNPNLPPMGLRLRLKASFDISPYSPQTRIILTALQHYGMIVADNGSCCFISGTHDDRWNNPDVLELRNVLLSNFDVVDESSLEISPDSAEARSSSPATASPSPTPTPAKRPTATSSHVRVSIEMPVASPTPVMLAPDQKKQQPGVAHVKEQQNWMYMAIPVAGVMLLLGGFWWRRRQLRSVKRE
ncbi:hypothetical protein [Dictyobacter kobayashii]|uniref:Uncharacterized protein n=1 Tax=Dictyobacter kobayashii TaxID=2014872 RepID=A0A402ALQ4_9CHLR|nr:hypothetical protein [Dictyobacter kobayashii]GCE20046.1 hypothetical protein KDK_38460 [Dictyobacter kobayashii]